MKKLILFLLATAFFARTYAQEVTAKEVPAPVTNTFDKAYPNMKDVEWAKAGKNYQAQFEVNKVESTVLYDVDGYLISTEINVPITQIPQAALDYANKNYAGQTIKESSRITSAGGTVSYELDLSNTDLIFDAKGTFVTVQKDTELH